MDKTRIYEIIKKYVSNDIELTDTTSFIGDLGWSSLTMLNMILDLESSMQYSLELGQFQHVKTVGDLVRVIADMKQEGNENDGILESV